jgi:tripartite-type tricarboxylate transporter receptor subunit TctC
MPTTRFEKNRTILPISRKQLLMSLPALLFADRAFAQFSRIQPIRMILSTSPGGGADVTTRLIAPRVTELLQGQTIIIEGRPGGGGLIAGSTVAREAPDGLTFLVDITSHAVNPAIRRQMPYKVLEDLVPVTQVVRGANVLVVASSLRVTTLSEFVAMVKEREGRISYASSGVGSAQHLAMEIFKAEAGLEMIHVPYRGGGPALVDLMAGTVQAFFAFLPSAAPYIRDGRMKAIATTGSVRAAAMPDLPTIAESGYPDFESYDWNGIFAPAHTPDPAIRRLRDAVAEALTDATIKRRLEEIGIEPVGSTSEEFRSFLEREIVKYREVVQRLGITVD